MHSEFLAIFMAKTTSVSSQDGQTGVKVHVPNSDSVVPRPTEAPILAHRSDLFTIRRERDFSDRPCVSVQDCRLLSSRGAPHPDGAVGTP